MQLTQGTYKSKFFILIKYLFIFGLFFVANKAGINGYIYPFVFGLFLHFYGVIKMFLF